MSLVLGKPHGSVSDPLTKNSLPYFNWNCGGLPSPHFPFGDFSERTEALPSRRSPSLDHCRWKTQGNGLLKKQNAREEKIEALPNLVVEAARMDLLPVSEFPLCSFVAPQKEL